MLLWIFFFLALSLKLKLLLSPTKKPTLPPGPPAIPFVLKNAIRRTTILEIEPIVRRFHARYGPIVSISVPFQHPTIIINDRRLAHEALVQRGAAFADRPPVMRGPRTIIRNHRDISTSSCGPFWRLLRRNLASEILQPSRLELFAPGRRWALGVLFRKLTLHAKSDDDDDGVVVVVVKESFRFATFSLLLLMCFGEKFVDEKEIEEIQSLQYYFLRQFIEINPFKFLPQLTKYVFRNRWSELVGAVRRQESIFVPLIRLRQQHRGLGKSRRGGGEFAFSYVDSLLDVELADEGGRKFREDEIASLCQEFISAGTDTTSTMLEWIMAELVNNREVQDKLYEEIRGAVADAEEEIKEEDLKKMPYLRAVVMEGLRRHPPARSLLPHKTTEDVMLGGYSIPKGAEVHINVVELGWDEKVWDEPMAFKPERFLTGDGSGVDITGSREIKMMPFGAGRRICPGYELGLLQIEYFVANLVREFDWKPAAGDGEEVDLTEVLEFTTVMKNPLRARIRSRTNKSKLNSLLDDDHML